MFVRVEFSELGIRVATPQSEIIIRHVKQWPASRPDKAQQEHDQEISSDESSSEKNYVPQLSHQN
jgi:hypothetical protein